MNTSVVASAALGAAWTWVAANDHESAGSDWSAKSVGKWLVWRAAKELHSYNQVLPAVLTVYAASRPSDAISAACSLGISDLFEETPPNRNWLGQDELSSRQYLALMLALTIWRAEKMESLLQRIQRSAGEIKKNSASHIFTSSCKDPGTWVWPPVWGIARRLALISIASFGCVPFVLTAFPSVVLDECLWWALAKVQDLWSRKVCSFPAVFDFILFPLLDLIHFVPVFTNVLLLGLVSYAEYSPPGIPAYLLIVCAFAWTAHNVHTIYTTLCVDLPDSARQLWAARNG